MWRQYLATLVVATVGCSGAAPRVAPAKADEHDRKQAASYARGVARDFYQAVRHGHAATQQTLLADDAFVIGPAADQLYGSRTDAMVAATKGFEIADRHRVRSRGLTAASSPTGTSAWFVNRIDIDRRHYTFSAVLTQVDEIWYVVAADLGAVGGSHTDALPPLPGGAANGTDVVVSLVREGAADPAKFLDQLDGGRDTVVLGPGRRDYARGARSIERHWKHEKLAKHPLELQGEPRAGITPDGSVVWVAGNAQAEGKSPVRIFWIYRRAAGDSAGWKLVLMQWARA